MVACVCPRERVSATCRDQTDHRSTCASRTSSSISCRSVGVGKDSGEGDLGLKSSLSEETEIPSELRAPKTKLEKKAARQLDAPQAHGWRSGEKLLVRTDWMLEHEDHKTRSSHAQVVNVSKARALVIFVDSVVPPLEGKSRVKQASDVPKMIGTHLDGEKYKRCVQFTGREREIEAKIVARKVFIERAVALNSGVGLYVRRDPSVKDKHQSGQELSFGW